MTRHGTLSDTLRPRLHRLIVDLWTREDAAREFSDPEGVHQMRVASRKLRAALAAGDGVFTRRRERRLRKEMRRLALALGAVRDADVIIATLNETAATGEDHPGIRRLIDRLDRQRDADRERLLALLDEMANSGFREASLKLFVPKGGARRRKIRRRDARALIEQPRKDFIAESGRPTAEEDIEGLHRLRIAAKRLRYVLQIVEPALAPESAGLIQPLGEMQDHLGDIHNDDVLIALVREELHALANDTIDAAMSGGTAREPATVAAWDDLLALLATTARDRHIRYTAFAEWWNELQDTGLTGALHSLGTSRRAEPSPN